MSPAFLGFPSTNHLTRDPPGDGNAIAGRSERPSPFFCNGHAAPTLSRGRGRSLMKADLGPAHGLGPMSFAEPGGVVLKEHAYITLLDEIKVPLEKMVV